MKNVPTKTKDISIPILSISIGIVYLWFGVLKFFPGLSPAEGLAVETIAKLTFHFLDTPKSLPLLAIWECLVGVLLILNIFRRVAIPLALVHIVLTFTPMLLFPEKVFSSNPLLLTMTGQYIIKNIIIISVLLVLWKQVQGRKRATVPFQTN